MHITEQPTSKATNKATNKATSKTATSEATSRTATSRAATDEAATKEAASGRAARRRGRFTVAAALLAAVTAGGLTGGGGQAAPPSAHATGGGERNDRNATVGRSQGPVSSTPAGIPPLDGQARRRADGQDGGPAPRAAAGRERDEVETGESVNPYSTRKLAWRSGPVQTSPRVYLVLWGPSWGTASGDPYGVASRLHYFYGGLGGSSLANVLKQYSGSTGPFSNPAGQYRGWIQDTSAVPTYPSKQDMANTAARAAVRLNDLNYNAQFVIATPWGVVDQFSTQNSFCAWHDYTYIPNRGSWFTYTSMPYMPYMDRLGRGCGGGKVNGANGTLDGVTILASHEYAETVNDPLLNGWTDPDGSENGDKCSWTNLANVKLANGYLFPVQPSWSNIWRDQYGYGCLYSA
jgi:serine protease